jgi:predicted dehydrogenase
VTVTTTELKSLLSTAAERNLFFMEALWTRFQPLMIDAKGVADSGVLGAPVMLQADLSHDFDLTCTCSIFTPYGVQIFTATMCYQAIPKTHRILDPALGGGALLDL